MVHDRIADDGHLDHVGPLDAGLGHDVAHQGVERLAHDRREVAIAARVHHDVGDAAHQVFAEADLRVHQAGGRQHGPGDEVAEVRRDGGRADVDRDAEGPVGVAGPDRDERAIAPHRRGHLPQATTQGCLELAQDRKIGA